MTDAPDKINTTPTVAIYNRLPLKSAIQDAKPPKESEPVSPIKMLAGFELKQRYAISDADIQKAKIDKF